MLLKNTATEAIDYLREWPAHYYEIETATGRIKALDEAAAGGFSSPADVYYRALCERRFFSRRADGGADAFMHAWMMIKASASAGTAFFQKKRLKRELESYMRDLLLLDYTPADETARAALTAEWSDFSRCLLSICTGSKAYGSTLFGFVPMKDATLAEKIAAEIYLVTEEYPARFGLSDAFAPMRTVAEDTYCRLVADGVTYLSAAKMGR